MSDGGGDLVEWLRQQLDEDERVAKAAIQGPWRTGAIAEHLVDDVLYGRSPYAHDGPGGDKIVQVANLEMAWQKEANAEHIARWDPARVLREVEAKRRLLDELLPKIRSLEEDLYDERGTGFDGGLGNEESALLPRLLALPYSDRPGFREEWRP